MRSLARPHVRLTRLAAASCLFLSAAGSLSCSSPATDSAGETTTVTKAIGPAGGTIEIGGAVVTFPKDAVSKDTTITIAASENAVPAGFVSLSKLFRCEPTGTDFAQPVVMRMPFVDDGKGGSLFWSSPAEPAFKDLGGRVEGKTMVAEVKHFSEGFVGRRQ